MSKQLIFLMGVPYSGRTTFINKKYSDAVCVDANDFPNLYTGEKLSNDSIEKSRLWCLERVRDNMCGPQTNNEIEQTNNEIEQTNNEIEQTNNEIEQTNNETEQKVEFTPAEKIVLVLIACRPERLREFIELAIQYDMQSVINFHQINYYITTQYIQICLNNQNILNQKFCQDFLLIKKK